MNITGVCAGVPLSYKENEEVIGRTRVGIYDSGPAGMRESTWVHGRREWYRKLCTPATEVDELGARVAQSLWAEEESPAFNIRERFRDITKVLR